jgi:hypothetical protein
MTFQTTNMGCLDLPELQFEKKFAFMEILHVESQEEHIMLF